MRVSKSRGQTVGSNSSTWRTPDCRSIHETDSTFETTSYPKRRNGRQTAEPLSPVPMDGPDLSEMDDLFSGVETSQSSTDLHQLRTQLLDLKHEWSQEFKTLKDELHAERTEGERLQASFAATTELQHAMALKLTEQREGIKTEREALKSEQAEKTAEHKRQRVQIQELRNGLGTDRSALHAEKMALVSLQSEMMQNTQQYRSALESEKALMDALSQSQAHKQGLLERLSSSKRPVSTAVVIANGIKRTLDGGSTSSDSDGEADASSSDKRACNRRQPGR